MQRWLVLHAIHALLLPFTGDFPSAHQAASYAPVLCPQALWQTLAHKDNLQAAATLKAEATPQAEGTTRTKVP